MDFPIAVLLDIANVVLVLIGLSAAFLLMRLSAGTLRRGWRMLLIALVLALAAEVSAAAHSLGFFRLEVSPAVRFGFLAVLLVSLWTIAKALDEGRKP